MGFNPPIPQQDSNWEIRVAVLLSLLLQALLIFLGPMRKRSSAPLPRFTIWACYLLADWVADLALGLLLNNVGTMGGGSGSSSPMIFAFWTPFLLLHLGGPDTITAYSLEDNELWLRHLIGLLFELVSAAVIIVWSLRANPMIHATVLVFVAGVIKYLERTYSMYCGSMESLRTDILGPPERGWNYRRLMSEFESRKKCGVEVEIVVFKEIPSSKVELLLDTKSMEARAYEFFLVFRRLFSNLVFSYQERQLSKAFFLHRQDLTPSEACEVIKMELNFIYDMVYTKAPVAHTKAGWVLRCICSGCLVSAIAIFLRHDKRAMNMKRVDVGITYMLLLGALALDAAALAMLLFSDRAAIFFHESRSQRRLFLQPLYRLTQAARRWWRPQRWSQSAAQLNLISYALGMPVQPRRRWHRVSQMLRAEGLLDDLIFIRDVPVSDQLLEVLFNAVREAAQAGHLYGDRRCRGERAIGHHKGDIDKLAPAGDKTFDIIIQSVQNRDFDESLLLWHIATDLCHGPPDEQGPPQEDVAWMRPIAETLSEYMLYLLVKQPEIVSPRTPIWLMRYQDTCVEARRVIEPIAESEWFKNHVDAREALLGVETSKEMDRRKSVLLQACVLAKALMKLGDDLRWKLVSGVWVEMLLFAARECRGTTHLRQLNRGGELITLLWFLMENMGIGDTYHGDPTAKLIVKY